MNRVILDTNIFVSFLITKKNTAVNKLFQQWENGDIVVYLSNETLIELTRVLLSEKIKEYTNLTKQETKQYLKSIVQRSVLINVDKPPQIIDQDPSDNKFIGLAEKAQAEYIITGDNHLLNLKEYKNTKIITPKDFILETKT